MAQQLLARPAAKPDHRPGVVTAIFIVVILAAADVTTSAVPRATVFNDIVVNEIVQGDVVAFEADVHLGPRADVAGDVVVVGGDLRLDDKARVGRHVLTVFGDIHASPGAVVEGRTLEFSSLSNVVLRPGEDMPLQVNLAIRLLTSGGWLLITTALAFGLSTRLRYGVWVLPRLGLRVLFLGVAAGVTFFAAVVAVLALGPSLGVPLAAAVTAVFFALRAVGLTVIGGFFGSLILRRLHQRPMPLTLEVFVGVLLLLLVRFLPLVGGVLWSLCSIAALGTGIIALVSNISENETAVGLV